MQKIYITKPIPEAGLSQLREKFEVTINETGKVLTKEELIQNLTGQNYEALISLVTDKIDDQVLTAAGSQLKIVANYAVGFDNVDLIAAAAKNIFVTNT